MREIGQRELGRLLGLPVSTVHRFLTSLEELNYLSQNPKTGNYRLGLKFLEIGMSIIESMPIIDIASDFLEDLVQKSAEAVHLGMLDQGEVVFIGKGEPFQLRRTTARVGSRVPAHSSAIGKVLLAYLATPERRNILSRIKLHRFTDRTIICREELEEHLQMVKRQGWAMCDRELRPNLVSVAAPIHYRGSVEFAVSVIGPSIRLRGDQLDKVKNHVCQIAKDISLSLEQGGRG